MVDRRNGDRVVLGSNTIYQGRGGSVADRRNGDRVVLGSNTVYQGHGGSVADRRNGDRVVLGSNTIYQGRGGSVADRRNGDRVVLGSNTIYQGRGGSVADRRNGDRVVLGSNTIYQGRGGSVADRRNGDRVVLGSNTVYQGRGGSVADRRNGDRVVLGSNTAGNTSLWNFGKNTSVFQRRPLKLSVHSIWCLYIALTCIGPFGPRGAIGALWWTSSSVLSTPVGCVPWPESQRRICRSNPQCCQSSYFSARPFFDCLRLFPVVSHLLGRPIVSRAHTISVFSSLQLPGDLRTVLYAL